MPPSSVAGVKRTPGIGTAGFGGMGMNGRWAAGSVPPAIASSAGLWTVVVGGVVGGVAGGVVVPAAAALVAQLARTGLLPIARLRLSANDGSQALEIVQLKTLGSNRPLKGAFSQPERASDRWSLVAKLASSLGDLPETIPVPVMVQRQLDACANARPGMVRPIIKNERVETARRSLRRLLQ